MRLGVCFILGIVVLNAAPTASVAQTPALSCHGAQRSKKVAELIFGRDIGKRLGVSETDFARFVAREITPRFPDGLTITDAVGQWRDRKSGSIVREPSKEVEIVLAGDDGDQARLDAVVSAYKLDFRQQSVAVIVRDACVSF